MSQIRHRAKVAVHALDEGGTSSGVLAESLQQSSGFEEPVQKPVGEEALQADAEQQGLGERFFSQQEPVQEPVGEEQQGLGEKFFSQEPVQDPVGEEVLRADEEQQRLGEKFFSQGQQEPVGEEVLRADEEQQGPGEKFFSEGQQVRNELRPRRPLTTLPISEQFDQIKLAVESQRVVVIIGGTGCGKSTQVPQYILDEAEAQGQTANVLVTQPRRMAAVTLAQRVAEERGEQVGKEIGYRIRGDVLAGRQLSFATAGYLLSWFTVDPTAFESVTHIVLDEAHERDAQFELLLLLVRLLMRIYAGPRLILMSATIESSFFAKYFQEFAIPRTAVIKPLVVESRCFDIETFFLDDLAEGKAPRSRGLHLRLQRAAQGAMREVFSSLDTRPRIWRSIEAIALEVIPLVAEGGTTVLVFVPGYADLCRIHSKLYWSLDVQFSSTTPIAPEDLNEDEIEELAALEELQEVSEADLDLRRRRMDSGANDWDDVAEEQAMTGSGKPESYRLFALHSQVPVEDQELVLERPPPNICHIVLATTIAESSLTLPEVSGVVDFGVHKTTGCEPSQPGLTQLRTEWCAQSSLTQRAGRAGRTRPGWCICFVPKEFVEKQMPVYNTPEILRTPLTKLYLQAKGISDGLKAAVQDDAEATRRLGSISSSAGELLMQLPSPPQESSIESAVYELAELGVLTEESDSADVTVLGRIALWLPLDVRLCRLVWLGSLWGCAAEAVVLAAACSTVSPFHSPSRLAFTEPSEFTESLLRSAESRSYFDGGHLSEPLMCLRLFCSWARRLALTSAKMHHRRRWFMATASLVETVAVDSAKMSLFITYIADVAIRARDICSTERGACKVREDLHLLVRLLRRPDLTYKQQKERGEEEPPPRVGEVFRAKAEKLYALLAAAFSDQLLVGKHKFVKSKALEPMLDALEALKESGIASADAALLPLGSKKTAGKGLADKKHAKNVITSLCGQEPSDVAVTEDFVACSFRSGRSTPAWLRDEGPSRPKMDQLNMGLLATKASRLRGLTTRPRLLWMAAGGLRTFTLGRAELLRAVSPYELEFDLVQSSGSRAKLPGVLSEYNPLGFACHITNPEVPLGAETFACVAANLVLGEAFGSVRVNEVTLLTAEQLVYTLTTFCPTKLHLVLGFKAGPGGDAASSRAQLAGLSVQKNMPKFLFTHHVPGNRAIELVNQVRGKLLESLVQERPINDGAETLLWKDEEAEAAVQALVNLVERAPPCEAAQLDEGAVMWVKHTPPSQPRVQHQEAIQALQPIVMPRIVESKVAKLLVKDYPKLEHNFECPDCGEVFMNWSACLRHYEATCHMDVSSEEAVEEAKACSRPVRFRCLECAEPFYDWKSCAVHLRESGHLTWASEAVAQKLCMQPGVKIEGPSEPSALPD